MSSDEKIYLNKLFQGLPSTLLDDLSLESVTFQPDEVIFREGDPAECLFIIESGHVRISKLGRGGKQEQLALLEPGDHFGEMGIYTRSARSAQATAVERVQTKCVGIEAFHKLLEAAPATLVTNLLTENVSRLRDTDAHFIREMLEAERMSLIGSMLSTIIHDIRSPLSIIRGTADLLAGDPTPERRDQFTAMLKRSVDRISDMIQELLDFSRGSSTLDRSPVPIGYFVRELEEELFVAFPEHIDVEVRVETEKPLYIDRSRFHRVVQNISKNAVEAMPAGGTLTLTFDDEDGITTVEIADTGKGIPADLLPRIFDPFVTHGKSGGTGLGMAIVRSVVDAHGGSISVNSTEGKGTEFTIAIPDRTHAEQQAGQP